MEEDAVSEPVLYAREDAVAIITLNLPEMRNPISEREMVEGLTAALTRADADPEVRVAILTGAGKAFSSGGNIKSMEAALEQRGSRPIETIEYYRDGIQRIPLAFERLEVPIIAAVNGPAIGAGCDLACMCDMRIAAESARFAESFVKMSLIPGDGGGWFLPRVVGYAKAAEMTFTGDQIDAREALACGLVSQVVPDAELMTAARALAARVAANPRQAVRMAKRLMVRGREMSLAANLEMCGSVQALIQSTADHREAVHAFLEKRKPNFRG